MRSAGESSTCSLTPVVPLRDLWREASKRFTRRAAGPAQSENGKGGGPFQGVKRAKSEAIESVKSSNLTTVRKNGQLV